MRKSTLAAMTTALLIAAPLSPISPLSPTVPLSFCGGVLTALQIAVSKQR
jgi:hypothetical protein